MFGTSECACSACLAAPRSCTHPASLQPPACPSFLNEKEQPLHVIIARGARIYGFKPPGRKGEHVVSLRHFMRILTLPVFRNQARRDLAVSIVKAAQAGTVPFSDVAPLHFSESGVAMLLKASRLSTLLLPNKVASSLYCKVSNLEAMYAPALRAKLLRRKEKLGKLRSADLFFLRRRGRPLFQHWASLYQRRKRLATLLGNMERMVVHSWGRLSMQQWRDFLLQTQEAVRVQALFRGYRIRMAFYRASQARFIAQHISKARHWQIKAKYELQKAVEEELSAIVIQALVRGVVQRRRLLHKLLNRADPGTFAWRMKLRRDGTHQRHDSATVIQCAFRQFMARGIADRLWAARYEAEQAREADKAAMAEKQRRDRKAIQVVERMVAQRLEQRMAELTAQAQARETAAQVSTLQSKRQYAAKKRRMEEAAADVRKQHTQRMLEFNAEWDERHAKAVQETKEEWEGLVLHKRPGDDEQDRQRSYDIARGEYMQIAKRLAAVHHNAVDLNVVEAKTEFIESKMAEAAAATAAKRKAARTRLAAELKRELASFRTERDQARSMGNEVAASKICAFILQCRQRAAMRAILKEDWEKGYDLHRGAVFYVNRRTGTVKYKKPVFLGPTDVAIVDRWTVQHSEQGGLTFFFNPRTHALSWTQPKFTMLCPRCQADFVQFTCEEGCGDMCSACWTAAHPSHKEHLAIHSWAAKDGGRPIHYLSSWDANRMYAAAELGDDAFHGRPSVGDIDRFSRRERLAAAADSAIQGAALAASGAAQGDAEGAEQEDDGDLPDGIDVAGGRQPAVAFATGAALERVHVLEQHRASTHKEGKDASYQGEAADALLTESGAEGKAGDGGEDVQDTGGHGLLDAVEPSPEPGPGHGAQEDSTAAHESYLAPDAFDGFEGPAAGGAAAAQGGGSAEQGDDWAGYDEYGGYYDEEGGYVDGEGGYTDVNGVYYPPE